MKKLVYKYTVKMTKNASVDTHYVLAYTEKLARTGLAELLKIEVDKLRFSPKNLPYKVRKAIFDKANKEYQLTLDVKKKPVNEISVEQRKANSFDLKASKLKSLKYKVKALLRHDKELLLEYSDFDQSLVKQYGGYNLEDLVDHFTYGLTAYTDAFKAIRKEIEDAKFEEESIDGKNIMDVLYTGLPGDLRVNITMI